MQKLSKQGNTISAENKFNEQMVQKYSAGNRMNAEIKCIN